MLQLYSTKKFNFASSNKKHTQTNKQTNKKTVRIDPSQMMYTYMSGLTKPHLSFMRNCLYKYFELCLAMWKMTEVTVSRVYLMIWSERI